MMETILLGSPRRTIAKSFRIDEKAYAVLREEADYQALSLNALTNQLLLNYANFGRILRRLNGVLLSQETVRQFIQNLPEETAIEVGKSLGKTSPQILMTAMDGGNVTVGRVMELIHNLSFCANWFQYTETTNGGHSKITLMHDFGRNWSQFITHYLNGAFNAAGCHAKYETTDRHVTFTV